MAEDRLEGAQVARFRDPLDKVRKHIRYLLYRDTTAAAARATALTRVRHYRPPLIIFLVLYAKL
jgi:hypothetical protein